MDLHSELLVFFPIDLDVLHVVVVVALPYIAAFVRDDGSDVSAILSHRAQRHQLIQPSFVLFCRWGNEGGLGVDVAFVSYACAGKPSL